MSTRFYFHGLKIKNFRAFEELTIPKFKRINIIGGFNGTGKSALLEIIFSILDRRHPMAIMKPRMWRRLETPGMVDVSQLFQNPDLPAEINADSRDGKIKILYEYKKPPPNIQFYIQSGSGPVYAEQAGISVSSSSIKGLMSQAWHNDSKDDSIFLLPTPDGLTGNVIRTGVQNLPLAQIIASSIRGTPQEAADRLSNIIRQRQISEITEALRILTPELSTLSVLQAGNVPEINAHINDNMLPIQYLGDGFQNLFHLLLGIMNNEDGIVLLDEIDAAIHYSVVERIWKKVAEIASKKNCQIFATSHSRECINSAAAGIRAADRSKDFQYLRLEKAQGAHRVISYSMDEIEGAEEFNVEIR